MGIIYAFLMRGIKFKNDRIIIMLTDKNTITYTKDKCKITCRDDMVINVECKDTTLNATVNFTTHPSVETRGKFAPAKLLELLNLDVNVYDDGRLITGFPPYPFNEVEGDSVSLIAYLKESVEAFDSVMVPTDKNIPVERSLDNPGPSVAAEQDQYICTFRTSGNVFHGIIIGKSNHHSEEDIYSLGA